MPLFQEPEVLSGGDILVSGSAVARQYRLGKATMPRTDKARKSELAAESPGGTTSVLLAVGVVSAAAVLV